MVEEFFDKVDQNEKKDQFSQFDNLEFGYYVHNSPHCEGGNLCICNQLPCRYQITGI